MPSDRALPSSDSDELSSGQKSPWLVELAVRQTATQAERLWAWMRILFCGLALLVFASNATLFRPPTFAQIGTEMLTFVLALLFSALILAFTRKRLASLVLHRASVSLDALLVGLALGSNHLTSNDTYHGVLMSLDVAAAPLVVTASLVRVDTPSVWISSGLVALVVGLIVGGDAVVGLPIPEDKLLLLCLYHAGATFVAYFGTRWLRMTVEGATLKAVRSERARGGLLTLLSDRHNLRSTLTNLQMNGDRLSIELDRENVSESVQEIAQQIQSSVERIGLNVHASQAHTLAWLDQTADTMPADMMQALHSARDRVRKSFPELEILLADRRDALFVLFGGGTSGLERIFESLFQNAAEGRAGTHAQSVSVSIERARRGRVIVEISDDGPGFPENLGVHLGQRGYSTKPGSLGLGLWLAHSAMLTVGGRLDLVPSPTGARMRLLFQDVRSR